MQTLAGKPDTPYENIPLNPTPTSDYKQTLPVTTPSTSKPTLSNAVVVSIPQATTKGKELAIQEAEDINESAEDILNR